MRRLFSIECDGLFWVEEENAVYSIFDNANKSFRFYDGSGNVLPDYQRAAPIEKEAAAAEDDEPVISEDEESGLVYNQYGVACGNSSLVDRDGNEIPDTKLNLEDCCGEFDRYFVFALISVEQCQSIDCCGTAEGITVDIYDTKTRTYVAKGVPECKLDVSFYDGEPAVIQAAIKLLPEYDSVDVCRAGTIIAKCNRQVTVYDYYG